MEVDFANNRIRKDCSLIEAMRKKFGDRRAEVLNTRLKQLLAATSLEDLRNAPGNWHELSQNRKGQISAKASGKLIV